MTIEMCTLAYGNREILSRKQLAVGETVNLGKSAINKELLEQEQGRRFRHKVFVKSHDEVEDKIVDSLDNGFRGLKIKDYINENPPWARDEKGNLIIFIWSPTVFGENGDGKVTSLPNYDVNSKSE